MNIKKALVFIVFLSLLTATSSVQAAGTDSRYFVKSGSQFWKKSFQVRHAFDSGFTADLTDWQVKLAKVFNVEITPVRKLNILAPKKTKPPVKIPLNQVGWGVRAIYGDDLDSSLPSGGQGVKVAILDTGVLATHPDLKDRIVGCNDLSGEEPMLKNSCDDKNGHGSQVAGVVAADGGPEGKGIYGVAPESELMIYKVCANDGTCFSDDVAIAIRQAADDGASIILLSIGSDSQNQIITDAISYASEKGAMIIGAVGNDGPYSGSIDYPAALETVISVGAMDQSFEVPEWSARGKATNSSESKKEGDLEFVAPGVNIESTSNNNDYLTISGTSVAAAHIAGLAAKEWQAESEKPLQSTRDLLHKRSIDIGAVEFNISSGWGMPQL